MAIKPICDKCNKELNDYGAILLSPPDINNIVKKYHLCKNCYYNSDIVINWNMKKDRQ